MISAEPTMEIPALPRRRRRPVLSVLVAVTVAAAGGGMAVMLRGDDGTPGRSHAVQTADTTVSQPATTVAPPASVTTAPAPVPTTTAPPTTVPERLTAESRLSLDGIGPVRIGMTLGEASAAAGVPLRLLDMPPGPECRYAVPDRSSGTGDELGFMVVDGRIARVDVGIMGPDRVRTVSGIGKGNTEAEVQATYPGRIRVEPHPYVPTGHNLVYVPSDPRFGDRSMIFETVDGRVSAFRAGLAGPVSWPEGCS